MYDTYHPKPIDLYFYPLPLMLVGTITFIRDGWFWFGTISFILGVGLGVAIVLGTIWDKVIEYWEKIDNTLETIYKIKDVQIRNDVRKVLGFSEIPERITIAENIDNGQGFISTKLHDLPITTSELQVISDVVLSGSPFSENELVSKRKILSAPKFRKLHKALEDKSFIKPHNVNRRNQGFTVTHKGRSMMYQYASESVKLGLQEK